MSTIDPTAPLLAQLRRIGLHQHCLGDESLLYRFRTELGGLLYLGVTVNPSIRWQAHKNKAAWWPAVGSVDVERYPHKHAAEDAERAAIRAEAPSFNVRSVPRLGAELPHTQSRNRSRAIPQGKGREGIGREWSVVLHASYLTTARLDQACSKAIPGGELGCR